MKTFLQFVEEKSVLGLIEFFNFEGLGKIPAKLDSGNGAYNVLHGEDIQEQGDKVFFTTVNGRKLLLPKVDQIDINDWQKSIDVNLTGMFLAAREAFRHMTKSGGRIINNGSISAHTPREGSAPYTSTKHAITGLTKTIALDGRDLNICCGQIDIGNAHTEMVANLSHANGVVETMAVSDAAEAVWNMAQLPLSTNILTMTIMANKMPFVGRG